MKKINDRLAMKAERIFLIVTMMSILLFPDCATLALRSKQTIPVTSTPVGATVIVNGVEQGVTPLDLELARKMKGQVIRIESPGYQPFEIRLERKLYGNAVLGNFLIGVIPAAWPAILWALRNDGSPNYGTGIMSIWALGAVGFGGLFTLIDSSVSGKGYMLMPKELTVTLKRSDGTPRVDTLLIDADAFRNVKWIRIHRD